MAIDKIAVLAGGLGTRMRPLTEQKPKCLIEINGITFLEYQIELFKKNNVKNIVLCLGYLSEQVREKLEGRDFGVNIEYSIEEELLGTAGALKNAQSLLSDNFFVINGDSYLPINFQEVASYFEGQDKGALNVVYKNPFEYHPNNTAIEGNLVTKHDKENPTPDMEYIDYGLSILKKEVLDSIPDGKFSLNELYGELIKEKELLAFETKQRFYEVGSAQGLKEFEEYAKKI